MRWKYAEGKTVSDEEFNEFGLRSLKILNEDLAEARKTAKMLSHDRDELIARLTEHGAGAQAIADVLGITRIRVYQIVNRIKAETQITDDVVASLIAEEDDEC
jgi:predicted transcriptional regulator YheO